MLEASIDEGIDTSLETGIDDFEDIDSLFLRNIVGISFQHLFGNHPFYFGKGTEAKYLSASCFNFSFASFICSLSFDFRAATNSIVEGMRIKSRAVTNASLIAC